MAPKTPRDQFAPETPLAGKAKAYSYVRFSTPQQAEGDSYRRQTELARRYTEAHGLELDASLRFDDLGVSAYHGRNKAAGALGAFLTAVGEGVVPQGSYLIVESLDRISRQTARKAARTLEDIVETGVRVVDLSDGGKVYDMAAIDDGFGFAFMILRFVRAHEESAIKAARLANAYEEKRRVAASGQPQSKPFTRMLPAWLSWNEESHQFQAMPERTDVVREIFARADQGWSKHRIAHELNRVGLEPWGKGKRRGKYWHSSYIQKLLTNAAVVGTFTPHRVIKTDKGRERKPLDPIAGYWPAAVDREIFERVCAQAKARAARGRHADKEPKDVFAGLMRCVRCGGSVVRVHKGDHTYLVCSKAHQRAGCKYLAIRYSDAERRLIETIGGLVEDAPRGIDAAALEAEIEQRANENWALVDQVRELADIAATEKSDGARRLLREREVELTKAEERLRELRARRDTLAGVGVLRRLEAIERALTREPLNVSEANKSLKQAVSNIVMDAERGTLTVYWHHADDPSDPIFFTSRHKRWENDAPSVLR